MAPTLAALKKSLRAQADPERVEKSKRFFKTGAGQYGEGDQFVGLSVPVLRAHVRQFQDLSLKDTLKLLSSRIHEERLCAVFLLVRQFSRGDASSRQLIYEAYLANTRYINNWDLVDSSAYYIPGVYLFDKKRKPLYTLAVSGDLWERRIAIIATLHFIRHQQYDDTRAIATLLLNDEQDLIHKAVGWMLREVGNRDKATEVLYLEQHYRCMPRTMLRYAIEKFSVSERKHYLTKT